MIWEHYHLLRQPRRSSVISGRTGPRRLYRSRKHLVLGACRGAAQLLHRAVGLIDGFVRVGKASSAKVATAAAVLCIEARKNEECEAKGKQKTDPAAHDRSSR